ncbi:hypothetical protein ARMGADRAFT_1006588 [Armillaria gallica]|uniref:Uncharacterized protein n=1 Tax=Armillaria gallica TaxID=47427 RepID=A0A2H3DYU9_ARMGA|nr:hypothetical protein ARMGADRAFT_1006588 [Armillaria gallica]
MKHAMAGSLYNAPPTKVIRQRNGSTKHGTPITRTTKLNEHDGTWNKRKHRKCDAAGTQGSMHQRRKASS